MFRTVATVITSALLGAAAAGAVVYTMDHDQRALPRTPGSTLRPLTAEEIDVLTEGDDWDHPWETCRINSDYGIQCPDGWTGAYPVPEPIVATNTPGDDGSVTIAGMWDTTMALPLCAEDLSVAVEPCRLNMDETYVVGGDGVRHDGCVVVLTTDEDSGMICRDDTVWAS